MKFKQTLKIMKKIFFILTVISFSVNALFAQKAINGVKLPDKMGFAEVVRNYAGGGVRQEFFVRAYVFGLYMKEKSLDPNVIINADQAMSIRLHMTSNLLTNKLMEEKIREGFKKSLNGKVEPYQEMIDVICGVFSSEPTKVGDVYDIHYTPGIGVSASKNGKGYDFASLNKDAKAKVKNSQRLEKLLGNLKYTKSGQSAIPDFGFKKALFGIWFCDTPVDARLKADVLQGKYQ